MAKPRSNPGPVVVIFVTRGGVREVQVHASPRQHGEGMALYNHLSPIVDRLDRAASSPASGRTNGVADRLASANQHSVRVPDQPFLGRTLLTHVRPDLQPAA